MSSIDPRNTPEINENVVTNYDSNLLKQPYNSTTEKLLDLIAQKIGGGTSGGNTSNTSLLEALAQVINGQKNIDYYIDEEGQWLNVIREKIATVGNGGTLTVYDQITPQPNEPYDIANPTQIAYGSYQNPYNLQFARQMLYRLDGNLNKQINLNNATGTVQPSLTGTTYQVIFKTILDASYFSPYNLATLQASVYSNSSLVASGQNFNVNSVSLNINTYELTVVLSRTQTNYVPTSSVNLSINLGINFDIETDNGKVRLSYSFVRPNFFISNMNANSTYPFVGIEIRTINVAALPYIPSIDALSPKQQGNSSVILTNIAAQEMIITHFLKLEKFRYVEIRFLPEQEQISKNYFTIDENQVLKFTTLEDIRTFKHIRGFENCINVVREHLFIQAHNNTQIEIKVII